MQILDRIRNVHETFQTSKDAFYEFQVAGNLFIHDEKGKLFVMAVACEEDEFGPGDDIIPVAPDLFTAIFDLNDGEQLIEFNASSRGFSCRALKEKESDPNILETINDQFVQYLDGHALVQDMEWTDMALSACERMIHQISNIDYDDFMFDEE